MSTRPYELLARFASDGTISGVHVRYITNVNGRDYEGDPQPLSGLADAAFTDFANQFAVAAVTERDSLQQQVAALTAERDTLQQQVAALTAERDTLQQQVAALQAQIDALQPQPGATTVWPRELMQRFTPDEIVAIQLSTDPRAVLARTHLQTTVGMIDTALPETQQLIGLIVAAGLVTEQRAAEILSPGA